ncbi:hypothetical protein WV31_09670 [Magnetospirillum sp. ME-1]|uniref:hypothetical protein n=1 Tax=Magnetospirillum sp. ME-1 TaxID=1639348 RepID=UPI000A17CC59|nr:hypothetical protein [Magnetospirillum sp. ME-1]ARJ65906.1 hypothetical protein WV31_09670 [Magnetospirillum sp. ME-1]
MSSSQLGLARNILAKVCPDRAVNVDKLTSDIHDLFTAIGLTSDPDDAFAVAFHVASEQASGTEVCLALRHTIASAEQLLIDLRRPEVADQVNMEAARIRRLMSRGIRNSSDGGASRSREMIQMIEDLKTLMEEIVARQRRMIRRGADQKTHYDTALFGLADIWLSHSGSDQGRFELPHSENSRFIKFCSAALGPYVPATEGSAKALANRWKRLKDRES